MQRFAPDTNFYLQFKQPQELPWAELTDSSIIELIVLCEVLNELDRHKNGGNERRADRSRRVLQQLRPLIRGETLEVVAKEAGPRVIYRLGPSLPVDRAKPPTLDMSTADGRIIEEILATQAIEGGITLLTHDNMPILTARRHGVQATSLPDEWRLPPEPDAKQKEIARLTAEVAALRNRVPKLNVELLAAGRPTTRIEGTLRHYAPVSPDFIRRAMEEVRLRYPKHPKGVEVEPSHYSGLSWAKYRSDYDEWLVTLQRQLERYHQYLNMRDSRLPLRLALENTGAASAEGLVVEVFVEGNLRLAGSQAINDVVQKGQFTLQEPPKMPRVMDFLGQISCTEPLLHRQFLPFESHLRHLVAPLGRDFCWRYDEPEALSERLEGTCGDFRHGIHREEVPLELCVPNEVTADTEGCIRIRFSAKNLIQHEETQWPVRLRFDLSDTESSAAALLKEQLKIGVC